MTFDQGIWHFTLIFQFHSFVNFFLKGKSCSQQECRPAAKLNLVTFFFYICLLILVSFLLSVGDNQILVFKKFASFSKKRR